MDVLSKYSTPLSIIVPVFNEEEYLFESLTKTYRSALLLLAEFEIVIVNDASSDTSQHIIDMFLAEHTNVMCVTHLINKGFGGAVKSALNICKYEYAICVPVDSPIDEKTLNFFLQEHSNCDIVISYRMQRAGYSKMMLFNSLTYHFLVSVLFGLNLKDYNWIHLYRTAIFKEIDIKANGIFMLAEVIIEASRKKFRIIEIPVEQQQRISGTATSTKLSSIVNVLNELIQYYFHSFFRSFYSTSKNKVLFRGK